MSLDSNFYIFYLQLLLSSKMMFASFQVEMSGTKGPITTFIVEPFVPHTDEYYLSIVSDRLGANVSFSECGGIDIEENWDKVPFTLQP
jgi:ATP citrate (pro-S)-lyase